MNTEQDGADKRVHVNINFFQMNAYVTNKIKKLRERRIGLKNSNQPLERSVDLKLANFEKDNNKNRKIIAKILFCIKLKT